MSKPHDIFQLIWKSSYAADKNTIDVVIKELNDEIRYQKTIAFTQAKTVPAKDAILDTLKALRKHRDELVAKYDDRRMPRDSGGLGGDPQDTDQNYRDKEGTGDAEYDPLNDTTPAEEDRATKSFKKSISKKEILKALYGRAWGTTAGLDLHKLEKMNDSDLDAHIKALEVLFD